MHFATHCECTLRMHFATHCECTLRMHFATYCECAVDLLDLCTKKFSHVFFTFAFV